MRRIERDRCGLVRTIGLRLYKMGVAMKVGRCERVIAHDLSDSDRKCNRRREKGAAYGELTSGSVQIFVGCPAVLHCGLNVE